MSHPSVRTCILPNRGIDWEGEAPAEPMRRPARQEPRSPFGILARKISVVAGLEASNNCPHLWVRYAQYGNN